MSEFILFLIFSIILETTSTCIDKITTTLKPNICNNYSEFCSCELNENCECNCNDSVTPSYVTNPPILCQSRIIGKLAGCLILPRTLLYREKQSGNTKPIGD